MTALMTLPRKTPMLFLMLTLALGSAGAPVLADDEGGRRLEGSWRATITATTPPGFPPMTSLITFTRDGSVVESRRLYLAFSPFGPLLETTGHGAWKRTGGHRYAVSFLFLLQTGPDNPTPGGEPLGTDNIKMRLRVEDDDTLSGTFQSEVKDNDGNVVFQASGTVAATRIQAE